MMIRMNSFARFMRAIAIFLFVASMVACGSDEVDSNNGNNVDSDMMMPDTSGQPDDGTPDMGETDPDMGDEPDFPLFDFGNFDFGSDMPATLAIDSVNPPRGPVDGGTPFVVLGSGFTVDSRVVFGGQEADVELIDGTLVGQTPSAAGPGPVTVKVFDPIGGDVFLDGGYEYVATLAVDTVTPNVVPSTGGVEVTVTGRGFDDATRVSFGGSTGVRHTLVNSNLMRVLVPAHPAGTFDVRASNRDATFVLPQAIEFFDALAIDLIRPATAPTAGGVDVTIDGAGFGPGMTFEFGGAAAVLQSVDATGNQAVVTVPANAAGLVDVRALTATDATIVQDAFYYSTGALAIGAVQPNEGQAVGGGEVTIIGAGLDDANLSVEFDGIAATIVDQGAGYVTVQIPAHAPGVVDVTVRTPTETDNLAGGFTYVDDIWIDAIMPNTGDAAGGYTVTLQGEGFTGATRVLFGVVSSQFTVIDDQNIEVTVPAQSAGVVDVTVERGSVDATFVDGFTYSEPIEVFNVIPARGSVAGNTYVTILGRGFVGNLSVEFDGTAGLDIQTVDAQTITVRTPPHAPGVVDVDVIKGQDTVTSPVPYSYFNPGARFGGAWGGPVQGAVNVTVYEQGGQPIEGAYVMLSTNAATPYQGETDVNGMVTLSGPDVFGEQTVTAIAAGYSSASVQRVNAENVTIFLSPPPQQGPPGPGPPLALFQGNVSGLDKLAEPGPTEFQMAIVYTTQVDTGSQNPDPGGGNVVLSDGPYTLNSRIGDLAIIAVGGLYDNATQTFKPLRMGIERFLFAAENQTYTVDLDLNIPLETPLTFKLNQPPLAPSGPTTNQIIPWLDLGFEGVFGNLDVAQGNGDIITASHMAPLTGVLSDASYYAIGGSVTAGGFGGPSSTAFKRNITNTNQVIEMPPLMGIATLTSPTNGQVPVDRTFRFALNNTNQPDFFYVVVTDFLQAIKWEVMLPGSARSFKLPDFPDFSHLPAEDRPVPYPGGSYIMTIVTVSSPGFLYDGITYADLSGANWDAYSVGGSLITF